jgi:hypothetical protein
VAPLWLARVKSTEIAQIILLGSLGPCKRRGFPFVGTPSRPGKFSWSDRPHLRESGADPNDPESPGPSPLAGAFAIQAARPGVDLLGLGPGALCKRESRPPLLTSPNPLTICRAQAALIFIGSAPRLAESGA